MRYIDDSFCVWIHGLVLKPIIKKGVLEVLDMFF